MNFLGLCNIRSQIFSQLYYSNNNKMSFIKQLTEMKSILYIIFHQLKYECLKGNEHSFA